MFQDSLMQASVDLPEIQTFYAIRNSSGQFYKTYSNSSGRGWVNELKRAKIWSNKSQAHSILTRLANERPKESIPDLVEFSVSRINIVPQQERVAKAREKKVLEDAARREREASYRLARAEADAKRAADFFNSLKNLSSK